MGQNMVGVWEGGGPLFGFHIPSMLLLLEIVPCHHCVQSPYSPLPLVSFALQQESATGHLPLRVDLSHCVPLSPHKIENNFRTQSAGGLWPLR